MKRATTVVILVLSMFVCAAVGSHLLTKNMSGGSQERRSVQSGPLVPYNAPAPPHGILGVAEALRRLKSAPTSADAHYQLAMAYYSKRLFIEALSEFSRAIDLSPNKVDREAYFYLAYSYSATEGDAKALKVYRRLLAMPLSGSQRARVHSSLGIIYKQAGDYSKAAHEFRASLAYEPHQASALFGLACVVYTAGNVDAAVSLLRDSARYADTAHNASIAHLGLGEIYKSRGDFAAAEKELNTAVKCEPGNNNASTELAELVGPRQERAR